MFAKMNGSKNLANNEEKLIQILLQTAEYSLEGTNLLVVIVWLAETVKRTGEG